MICVRCMDVEPTTVPPGRERTAPRPAVGDRARAEPGRAPRLHPNAGGRGARHQPLDLQPTRPAVHRHDQDAAGRPLDSSRRAQAGSRRAAPISPKAQGSFSPARASCGRAAGDHRPHPRRARRRQEPRSDRPRPQCKQDGDSARRRTLVAIHSPFCRLAIVRTDVVQVPVSQRHGTGAISLPLAEACSCTISTVAAQRTIRFPERAPGTLRSRRARRGRAPCPHLAERATRAERPGDRTPTRARVRKHLEARESCSGGTHHSLGRHSRTGGRSCLGLSPGSTRRERLCSIDSAVRNRRRSRGNEGTRRRKPRASDRARLQCRESVTAGRSGKRRQH